MTDTALEGKIGRPANNRLDLWLNITLVIALIGVLGLAGVFGWNVYQDRQRMILSNPATRLIAQLEDEVRQSPNNSILRVRLGEALASAGRYDDAVDQLNNALKIEPNHPGAYLDLGIIARLNGDNNAAIGYFNKVVEITEEADFTNVDERRELAYYQLGQIALEEERYEDSIASFKAALRIRNDASDTYYHLAKAYQGLGEPDAALENLEIALAFDPGFAEAHYLMGQIYLEDNDPINASVHFYRAAELAPEADPPAEALASMGPAEEWASKAQAALDDGNLDEAINNVLVAVNLAPDNSEYYVLHADILLARGDTEGAVQVLENAATIDPDNTEIEAKIEELKK